MTSVLMVTKYYPPVSYGGTEKYIEMASRNLVRSGLRVAVAGPSLGKGISFEESEGVSIYRFPIHRLSLLEFSREMRKFVDASSYDIVHFHTFESLCYFLRKGLRKPYVISTHGFSWRSPSLLNPIRFAYKMKITRDNFQKASRVFCVSRRDYEDVVKMLGYRSEKLCYLPSGVDIRDFSDLDRQSLKLRYALNDKIVITQVARFAYQKGQHVLLKALKLVPEDLRRRFVVFLAGHAHDNNYLLGIKKYLRASRLEREVFLLPNISDSQLKCLYGLTDIFVLPSFFEGLPLTLLEAWASKCAVIVTAVGGIPYVVRDGIDGFVIQPNDCFALSRKITSLALNEEVRAAVSREGFERVQEEFTMHHIVDFLREEYERVVEDA